MSDPLWHPRGSRGREFPSLVARQPGDTLLAFDFDGTLAHIVPNPEDSRLAPSVAEAFAALRGRVGQIAIITGRPVATIERLAQPAAHPGLDRAMVFGQYGVEHWNVASGERHDPPIPPAVGLAKAELSAALASWPGASLEDKGRAIAAHTRRADDPRGAFEGLRGAVTEIARRHGLVLEPGKLVWELRSASIDKGDALRELVAEYRPSLVLMAGDDLGDLPAFEALSELRERGIETCALVSGSEEQTLVSERADVLCEGPDGVAAWLKMLAQVLGEVDPRGASSGETDPL